MYQVLLIDDEPWALYGLKTLIDWEALGYRIAGEAENGLKAMELLNKGNIDVVISDIRMPEMRGDEFLEWIKSNQLFKHIPVVMLSSEDSTTERIRLLQEGAEDYIVKPFNPMELKVRIKKIIE